MKLLKITKYVKNFVLDSLRELVQIIFLFICIVFPSFVNLAEIIRTILGGADPTIENAKYYYLMISGNWTMGSIIALYVLLYIIRKSNKEKILNKGNIYHNKPYWWYWFCSKVLGYEKCNLILVPIHTQYKLVLRDTFEEYPFDKSTFPQQKCEIEINRNLSKENFSSKEINFIIQDTYPIYENQIPLNLREHNSISIKRHSNRFGERIYSKELIDTITEEIRSLNDGMTLNIFSTTNPKNTYEIIKNSIMLAERGNIKHVNVFQQNNEGEREFNNKPHKVI
jgi:hypothetical protein